MFEELSTNTMEILINRRMVSFKICVSTLTSLIKKHYKPPSQSVPFVPVLIPINETSEFLNSEIINFRFFPRNISSLPS